MTGRLLPYAGDMASTAQEQQLIVDESATVVGYPPELAQATDVTARIMTPATPLPTSGTAGTVDSVSTATNAAAKRGATSLSLAGAVSLVRGRRYVVVDATTGSRVAVEALVTGSSAALKLASPLPCDIASGSAVTGWAVTAALTAGEVGDTPGRGLVLWDATIGGVSVRWAQDLRVVRRRVAYSLTASDVEQLSPYASTMRPAADADWTESLWAAWSLYMVPAMLAKGAAPERVISWEALNPWHIAALEWHLAATTPEQDPDVRQQKKAAMVEARDLALASIRFWLDSSDDLAPPTEDPNAVREFTVTYLTR